jgi:hypothetical protein
MRPLLCNGTLNTFPRQRILTEQLMRRFLRCLCRGYITRKNWTKLHLSHVEAGSNTSTLALRAVGDNENDTQCLGVLLGHAVPGEYKYEDVTLQVGLVSNLRQYNMVMSPAGLGPENDCVGEGQQQL